MAYAVINKSGCVERKGNVQLRLDFFLEPTDPRYKDTLIKGKPTPFHSHFIYLDADFTEGDIKAEIDFHLPNFYLAFQNEWDKVAGGMRHGWAVEKRIPPLDYSLNTKRVAQCQDKLNRLIALSYKPEGKEGKEYPATEIDIGPGATDRISAAGAATRIDIANPANDTGIIDTFEVWAATTMDGTNKVGTFYGSGLLYTNRDGETIGTVEAGAKRTFTGLSIDVSTGDFAGIYFSVGQLERAASGGANMYYKSGDQFGTGEQTYTLYADDVISIYGAGETGGGAFPSSEKSYPVGWTPDKTLDATLSSQKSYPLGWTPGKELQAALSSEKSYPLGWTPGKELDAALTSQKDYSPGWTSESSREIQGEGTPKLSEVNWPLGWTSQASKANIVWKGLSDTLLAAQKKPHRIPYLEAKVYDFEQGIKRLTWTSLYTGSEPDNHHGIAFDDQGSMHRIRSGGSSTLLYQKITNPGPGSDYTQWTEIATDCYGPCAIAAYGAKIYVFYRTTGNVLWKYYSHDYGQAWDNAQLIAIADVLSMAAAWKGTTSTVVCFAATAIKISAVVLDTATQDTTEYYYNHALDITYGIGATYRGGEFPIIVAAKDTDSGTGIVTYSLYATKLSDAYNFGALRVLLSAQDDVSTVFKYPDCHSPPSPYDHEALQLTAVESYTGVTAYDRPLLAHLVKDTAWSSAVITEPKFFLDVSSLYGVRLMTNSSYWWLSKPDGVWRAPRPAEPPLDLTPYLQQLRQVIRPDAPGSLTLELDNSKGQFAAPGAGALASLQKRSEVVLKLGYRTTAGPELAPALHYWIDGWDYRSGVNTSVFVLRCTDLWGLAFAWSARYSLRWNYTAFQPCRVWEILYQLLGRFGIRLWNNGSVPQSDAMNNYYPKFLSRGGTNAATQLRRLLDFVTDGLVPREALCFAKDLLATETPGYEYKNQPGYHPLLKGEYGENLTITHTQVSGDTQDEPPVHVREAAFDWDNLLRGIDALVMQYDPNLEEPDQAQKRADALLRHEAQKSLGGQIIVPTNCGQELYDVISVTDTRVGLADKNFRVQAIQTDYDRRKGIYDQRLTTGAP